MHSYLTATILEKTWTGGTLLRIRFRPDVPFQFEAGQFISVCAGDVKRLYSLASPYESARETGYELCIKKVKDGAGSEFFSRIEVGETFQFQAPYGHFEFRIQRGRPVVFIATGSGIAPLRAIAMSKRFDREEIPFAMGIFGFRHAAEIPYPGEFESLGIATRYAISSGGTRVTDVLRGLKPDFPWTECDYYICGNPKMIQEVGRILRGQKVPTEAIHFESFEATPSRPVGQRSSVLQRGRNRAA